MLFVKNGILFFVAKKIWDYMLIKKIIKKIFAIIVLDDDLKIIVASNGRAGSTMLYNAIADGFVRKKFKISAKSILGGVIKKLSIGYVDSVKDLKGEKCVIIKTHNVYENIDNNYKYKFIFVYSDPLESAFSVDLMVKQKGIGWFYKHQNNLNASGDYSDLYKEDVLNYERQMKSWMSQNRNNIMCVAYEDLWDKIGLLSDFLGFKVELPVKRERAKKKKDVKDINLKMFEELKKLRVLLKKKHDSYRLI